MNLKKPVIAIAAVCLIISFTSHFAYSSSINWQAYENGLAQAKKEGKKFDPNEEMQMLYDEYVSEAKSGIFDGIETGDYETSKDSGETGKSSAGKSGKHESLEGIVNEA